MMFSHKTLFASLNFSLERALQLFTEARPPGIYKADYLQELYQRYDDPDDCPPAPELPDWCFGNNFVLLFF